MKVKIKRPLCLVCLLFVMTVFLYMECCPLPVFSLGERAGRTLQLTGQVYQKEIKNDKYVIYLKHVTFCNSENSQTDKNKTENAEKPEKVFSSEDDLGVMCYMTELLTGEQEPAMGSFVKIRGKLQCFNTATNPGEFDMAMYYRTLGYDFFVKNTKIIGETEKYDVRLECLYQIRKKLSGIYDSVLLEEDAGMMKAMVLGDKQDLEKESKDLFQKAGIAHILAISGLHISLLGMGLFQILRKMRMPMIPAALFSIVVMVQFGDMTGMSSSASRAIFMFACGLGAKILRRSYDLLSAMVTSCMMLLLEQPLYIYHSGFLLSFSAIMGIGIMEPIWTDGIHRLKKTKNNLPKRMMQNIWLALLGSIGIFAFQVPIMLSSFYELSPYSFLLNLIVIPLMGLVMLLGIIVLALGVLFLPFTGVSGLVTLGLLLEKIPGSGLHLLLSFFGQLCKFVLQLPGGIWIIGKPDTWQFILYGIVLLLIILLHEWLPKWMMGVWFFTAVSMMTFHVQSGMTITMLDVGQGDGICITSETGHHYLIDCGSTSKVNLGSYQLVPYLKYEGISELDAVFITHLDQDHVSGIRELLSMQAAEHIYIKHIVLAKEVVKDEAYETLITLCQEQQVPVIYMEQGNGITDGTLTISCLFPYEGYHTDDRNDASLVLDVTMGEFSGLFTGDVGAEGEQKAAAYIEKYMPDKTYELFKVTHHGSKYSNTEALLTVINPKIALISCGKDNDYGHPHAEVLERLQDVNSSICQTQESGAITVTVKDHSLSIDTFLGE